MLKITIQLFRPILEFSSTILDPHTARNINKLEIVQRRSTRYAYSTYYRMSSPTEMISTIRWESLAEQQWQAKTIMMFRICNNLIYIPASPLTPVAHYGHHWRDSFPIPYYRADKFKNSFIPTGTKIWNGLTIEERSSGSLEASKRKLCKDN